MLKAILARTGFGTICLATAAIGLCAGCNDGGEPEDAHSKIDTVREALESPTGTVDATTIVELNDLSALQAALSPIVSASSYAYSGSACFVGSTTEGTLDLSCVTKDSAEGQKLAGTITLNGDVSAGFTSAEAFVELTYDNVCDATRCVSGVIATETSVDTDAVKSTIAISLDVTEGTQTTHIFWGSEIGVSEGAGVSAKIALWDSLDHSFVLQSSVTEEGVSLSVTGSNGSFSCTATDAGGSCTGDGEINF